MSKVRVRRLVIVTKYELSRTTLTAEEEERTTKKQTVEIQYHMKPLVGYIKREQIIWDLVDASCYANLYH